MEKIAIMGSGYVGLVTGACFAKFGNKVTFVDNDENKIKLLKARKIPIYEPGLKELLRRYERNIDFTTDISKGVKNSKIIFITVGTPPKEDGSPDLSGIENVASEIGKSLNGYKLIVEKSTVPVETGEWVERTILRYNRKNVRFEVASNPEFLREGSAIHDFLHPDRIIIGVSSKRAENLLRKLYAPIRAPIIVTDIRTAELIKHASNSFLAMKISFINSLANLCELINVNIETVREALGHDKRIGPEFLKPGVGFGGSCLPKDLDAFYWLAKKFGYDFKLLKVVKEINLLQRKKIIEKVEKMLWIVKGKIIGILGASFKPNTDDIRNSPVLEIISELQKRGAKIRVYDPSEASKKVKEIFPEISICNSPLELAKDADCIILLTEWEEFRNINLKRLKALLRQPIFIDGRNFYEKDLMKKKGFNYIGVGR